MPKNLTDSSTFTDPVSVPVGSDSHSAASAEVPWQALANRTRYLGDRVGEGGDNEFVYPSAQSRTMWVPAVAAQALVTSSGPHWQQQPVGAAAPAVLGSVISQVNEAELALPLTPLLPTGAVLTEVKGLLTPGATRSGGDRPLIYLLRHTYVDDATAPTLITVQSAEWTQNVGIVGPATLSVSRTVNRSNEGLIVAVQAGNDAAANADTLFGVLLTFDDPGPRNF